MKIVAEMYQAYPLRCYEVAEDEYGKIHYREQGKRKWLPVHMVLNPDLDTYLQRCHDNFDYDINKF